MQKNLARLLGCAAAMAAFTVPASLVAQAAPTAAIARDGSHDMDFAKGNWRTDITRIKNPFDPNSAVVRSHGTKKVTPIWGGKGWLEEIEADGPDGHWEAANVTLYDPQTHQWNNYYAESPDGTFDATPSVGEYRDGNIEYYSQQNVGGRVMLIRGVWKNIKADSHDYEISRSIDGGRTWHPSFLVHVTRDK
jgi:hypothetical protein